MSDWNKVRMTTGVPADGEIVETKIDDEAGVRNEQLLKRQGNLWFLADGSMYVYYRPTHWRPADPAKVEALKQQRIADLEAELNAVRNS